MPRRRKRPTSAGGSTSTVASRTIDAELRARRQHPGEVVDEVLGQRPADEQRVGAEPLDLARDRDAFAHHRGELERVRVAAGGEGDGTRAGGGVPLDEPARLGADLGEQQQVERVAGRLEHVVEGVSYHAARGDDDAVADTRGRAADAVDGAVHDDLVGAQRQQAFNGRAQLGKRRRAADLDLAVGRAHVR